MNARFKEFFRTLPDNYQFSQGSLQAYVDCPRLFQLRYLEQLSWPAQEIESSSEAEHYLELGSSFHKMIHQFYLGVDTNHLNSIAARDPLLNRWWDNYLQFKPAVDDYSHFVEFPLSIPIDRYRLVSKYDLLLRRNSSTGLEINHKAGRKEKTIGDNVNWIIYDWKTNHKLPDRQSLSSKLQTRVYPFMLVEAGFSIYHGKRIKPENIQMVYWFSNFPDVKIQFQYSQEHFVQDQSFIMELIDEINGFGGKKAPKTENKKRCRFCVYRSLCNRGIKPGSLTEYQIAEPIHDSLSDSRFELDYDQIIEISL